MDHLYLLRITDALHEDGPAVAYAQGYELKRSHYVGHKPDAIFSLTGVQLLEDTWLDHSKVWNGHIGLHFESIIYRVTQVHQSMSLLTSATWVSDLESRRVDTTDQGPVREIFRVEVLSEFVELGLDGQMVGMRTKQVYR